MVLERLSWRLLDYAALTPSGALHHLGCRELHEPARFLRPGTVLRRHGAPEPCPRCRPRVDLRLGG